MTFGDNAQRAVGVRLGRRGRQLAGPARAGRRRRLHHAVELPAAPDRQQGRARARRGLHRRGQAERGRADQRVHPRRDHRRGRAAEGRLQPGHRRRPRRRRGDREPPARRHGLVHRAPPARASASWSSRAQSVKRVSLELGGKSANIICEDADLAAAIPTGVFACYLNSGQTCSAHTRMLVPRSKLAEVEKLAAETAETFTLGDPFAETTVGSDRSSPRSSATASARTSTRASRRARSWSPAAPSSPTASTRASSSARRSSPT